MPASGLRTGLKGKSWRVYPSRLICLPPVLRILFFRPLNPPLRPSLVPARLGHKRRGKKKEAFCDKSLAVKKKLRTFAPTESTTFLA